MKLKSCLLFLFSILAVISTTLLFQVYYFQCPTNQVRLFKTESSSSLNTDTNKKYGYVFYATDKTYLCNALINTKRLREMEVSKDIVILLSNEFQQDIDIVTKWINSNSLQRIQSIHEHLNQTQRTMYRLLQDYNAKLEPVELIVQDLGDITWRESLTKLRIFELEEYDRIIYMDADGLVLRNMDHLFSLPKSPVAMPRAYWLKQPLFSDQIAVVQPESKRLTQLIKVARTHGGFDMDVMDQLYKGWCIAIPNHYDLLTGEFRKENHTQFLGNHYEEWDPNKVLQQSFYIHFSDWPVPKPWISDPQVMKDYEPKKNPEKGIWYRFYETFREEMNSVCN